jgi:hypothetical protein
MLAHTEGVKEYSCLGLIYEGYRCCIPSMGPRMHQLLITLCVTSSLSLFALGGSDLTGGICLRTLSCCRPTVIMGPVLDTVAISRDVEGASFKEFGWCVNLCLLCPFTMFVRVRRFASSVVTPRGYKAGGHPYMNVRHLTRPPIISSPPSLRL